MNSDALEKMFRIVEAINHEQSGIFKDFLRSLKAEIERDCCCLYLLDNSTSTFNLVDDGTACCRDVESLPIRSGQTEYSFRDVFEITAENRWRIGLLAVDGSDELDSDSRELIELLLPTVASEYERAWVSHVFRTITTPVEIEQERSVYYGKLTSIAAEAAGMPLAALHRYNADSRRLHCLSLYALAQVAKGLDVAEHDVTDKDKEFEDLYRAMTATDYSVLVRAGKEDTFVRSLRGRTPFANVETVVVTPVRIGGTQLGTLIFGVEHETSFTKLQRECMLMIGNILGATLSNFEKTMLYSERSTEAMIDLKERMNMEIIQGLRHTSINAIHSALQKLKNTRTSIERRDTKAALQTFDEVDALVRQAAAVVRMQGTIADANDEEPVPVRLHELLESTRQLVQYKLENRGIDVNIQPSSITIEGHEGDLKYAFLNLYLNSIEALETARRKSGRKITVTFRDEGPRAIVYFADNGPGFVPNFEKGVAQLRDIWEPGKTTKENGTGFGLPFVRRVVEGIHAGSVDIVGASNGFNVKVSLWKKKPEI